MIASVSVREPQTLPESESRLSDGSAGIVPSQGLAEAIDRGWISSGRYLIPANSIQPASLDLRLGARAWALRCSFLPDAGSSVVEKVEDIAQDTIDIRDGYTLERDRPYLIELLEEVDLPQTMRA